MPFIEGESLATVLAAGLRSLSIAAAVAACLGQAAYAQSVRGIVVSDDSASVADAEVSLTRDGVVVAMSRSSSSGRFSFDGVDSGSYHLSARRLGYRPATITIRVNRGATPDLVRIMLVRLPAELTQIVQDRSETRLRDYYQRRAKGGLARFIDRAEIVKRNPAHLSDMFRRIPGASVRAARGFGNIVRIRGCQPTVWIDGKRMRYVELDEVTDPDAVAGLEVYNSPAGVPIEFTDPVSSSCGVILVWTRSR